jgi:hypothetical protein
MCLSHAGSPSRGRMGYIRIIFLLFYHINLLPDQELNPTFNPLHHRLRPPRGSPRLSERRGKGYVLSTTPILHG